MTNVAPRQTKALETDQPTNDTMDGQTDRPTGTTDQRTIEVTDQQMNGPTNWRKWPLIVIAAYIAYIADILHWEVFKYMYVMCHVSYIIPVRKDNDNDVYSSSRFIIFIFSIGQRHRSRVNSVINYATIYATSCATGNSVRTSASDATWARRHGVFLRNLLGQIQVWVDFRFHYNFVTVGWWWLVKLNAIACPFDIVCYYIVEWSSNRYAIDEYLLRFYLSEKKGKKLIHKKELNELYVKNT